MTQISNFAVAIILQTICVMSLATVSAADEADKADKGKVIFDAKCASCHGTVGQGVKDRYDEPLIGDLTLDKLQEIIVETMPEEHPEECVGEEAAAVARYIYNAFYSPAARADRNARVELARMTNRQYENAVADLVAAFDGPAKLDNRQGLSGEYFDSRDRNGDKRRIQRVDPQIDFDFGSESPGEKIAAKEFSILWVGSVFAEETGEYEFIIRSDNGFRLYVNDDETALIDSWVNTEQTEHRATIRLLANRYYPIKLECFKYGDDRASMKLAWRPPHQAEQIIPAANLHPQMVRPTMVITTPFPPDDSSVGYERGSSVSQAWEAATTGGAIEVAQYLSTRGSRNSRRRSENAEERSQKLKEYCFKFTERAFRRPLTDDERQRFIEKQFSESESPEVALKRNVILTLKSPQFLYPGLPQPDHPRKQDFAAASRLSFGLWDSIPDDELWRAAEQGKLHEIGDIERQAQRMVTDPRTKSKLRSFFHTWLHMDDAENLSKDQTLFPDFDEQIVSDLRKSLDMLLDQAIWEGGADFRNILLGEKLFLNHRLGKFYGVEVPDDGQFHPVSLAGGTRSGVITHPYLLTALSYHKSTSPIHRGVFIARNLLGRTLKAPPVAVAPLSEDFDPEMTTRQRVTHQTKEIACQSCHSVINPLGFSLENFDAVGRFRSEEKGTAIDANTVYESPDGKRIDIAGARQLAEFLAGDANAHRSFIVQIFRHVTKQPIEAYGAHKLDELLEIFEKSGYNVRQLLVEIAKTSAAKDS
jgi:mono/diheme cytochrome c family protein